MRRRTRNFALVEQKARLAAARGKVFPKALRTAMVKVRVRGVDYEVHPPHPGSSEPGYVVRIEGDRRREVWKKGKMPGVQTLSVLKAAGFDPLKATRP